MKIIKNIKPSVNEKEVVRLLGYKKDSTVTKTIADRISVQIEVGLSLAKPLAAYEIKKVDKVSGNEIFVDGHSFIKGKLIAKTLMVSDKIVLFLVTIGSDLENKISELMDHRKMTDAVILDAVGSDITEGATNELQKYIEKKELKGDKRLTLRYSPGYCDWDLSGQKKIFDIIDSKKLSVSLTEKHIMVPRKSVSGVIGIGDREKILENPSPCVNCPKKDCTVRR